MNKIFNFRDIIIMPRWLDKFFRLTVCNESTCLPLKCESKGGFGCFNSLSSKFIDELNFNDRYVSFVVASKNENERVKVSDTKGFLNEIKKYGIKFLHFAAYENTSTWSYVPEKLNNFEDIKINAFSNPNVLDEIQQAQKLKEMFAAGKAVEEYTTYKTFNNFSCFVIIPNPQTTFSIKVDDKVLKWIFIVLQEPCQSDLTTMKEIDFKTLDQDMSKFYSIYHKTSIHKDIKPSNIVYCNGKYKPIDFGLSKQLPVTEQNSFEAKTLGGTNIYMSPYLLVYATNQNTENNIKHSICTTNPNEDGCKIDLILLQMYQNYNVNFLKNPMINTETAESSFSNIRMLVDLWYYDKYKCLLLFLRKNDEFAYACTLVELYMYKMLINVPQDFHQYLHKLCDASEGLILSNGGYFKNQTGAGKYKKTKQSIMVGKQKRIVYEGPRKKKYIIYKKSFITMSKAKRLQLF